MTNKHEQCIQLFRSLCNGDKIPTLYQFEQRAYDQVGLTHLGAMAHFVQIVQQHTDIRIERKFLALSCFKGVDPVDMKFIEAHFRGLKVRPNLILVDK